MKLDCGETYDEKWTRLGKWHKWFAWYPVRVGVHDCRWFEYVERRKWIEHGIYDNFTFREYRPLVHS